jgi:hypothetical protein
LTSAEKGRLLDGETIERTSREGRTGKGVAVFLVDAPAWFVWSILRDVDAHHTLIENMFESEVYNRTGHDIYARFLVGQWGFKYEYFVRHHFPEGADYGTWTLDYTRHSDITDTVGYWRITPFANDPQRALVEYTSHARMESWMPNFIKDLLTNQVISEGALWLKRAAESQWRANKKALTREKSTTQRSKKATQKPPFAN